MNPLPPAGAYQPKILPLRQQLTVTNEWLRLRLERLIPEIMAREGLDIWLVIAREYNEDPVLLSLLPAPAMGARRRTILMFTRRPDGTVERLTVARYALGDFYESCWDPAEEEQYACLARLIRDRNPARIGINVSQHFAFGDGLSHHEYELLTAALGADLSARLAPAWRLCVGWLERRIPEEMVVYPGLVELGHAIIAEAFSSRVIQPGITTTEDVVWWMRDKMQALHLAAWFQPSISIQSPEQGFSITAEPARTLIMPGDLLHCDMGFYYLGLATDQQQHAYVLRPGEMAAPAGLQAALADGNKLQDILMREMQVGRTGNEVLRATLAAANAAGITPSVYTHPLGYHGHAAGPTIGLWDRQDGVPGNGDYELFDETCYSIELNISKTVPEWGDAEVKIALEEDAYLENGAIRFLHGRQTQFHLI